MPTSEATAAEDFASRAAGYGMPGVTIDGNDALAVHEVAEQAVARARSGRGPSLVEARITRWEAHAAGIADLRTPEDIAEVRKRDGVLILRENLIQRGVMSEADASAIEDECQREVDAAVEEGQGSGFDRSPPRVLSADDARQLSYAG
jgi:TPP-dependent pyruvate/acetoin dehydrogenase alpha subunit